MGRNTMAVIQTCQIQAIIAVPQRLSFSAQHCFPNHKETQMTIIHMQSYSSPCVAKLDKSVRSETRILSAIGAVCLYTAVRSAFSTFHTTFIRAIGSVVLSSSFI